VRQVALASAELGKDLLIDGDRCVKNERERRRVARSGVDHRPVFEHRDLETRRLEGSGRDGAHQQPPSAHRG
jgi:hypothetical protein